MHELFAGFDTVDVRVDEAMIHARVGGSGPPVLLLHGYPQTHVIWHKITPELAKRYTVVVADLRGYGDSTTTSETFTFRAMAVDQVQLMSALGHERFHVVGHDRGARVTHRMALDHPEHVASVTLLDILPTLDMWERMDAGLALLCYHWVFLAQDEFPARLINHDPVYFLHRTLGGLGGPSQIFDPHAFAEYERAARRPEVVAAWCKDYWFGARDDLDHDRVDLARILDIPALVLWGAKSVSVHGDVLGIWRKRFAQVTGGPLVAGHFLPEECPDQVLTALYEHLAASTAP
jgi:haloacetate dehalogenase